METCAARSANSQESPVSRSLGGHLGSYRRLGQNSFFQVLREYATSRRSRRQEYRYFGLQLVGGSISSVFDSPHLCRAASAVGARSHGSSGDTQDSVWHAVCANPCGTSPHGARDRGSHAGIGAGSSPRTAGRLVRAGGGGPRGSSSSATSPVTGFGGF